MQDTCLFYGNRFYLEVLEKLVGPQKKFKTIILKNHYNIWLKMLHLKVDCVFINGKFLSYL